MHKHHGWGWGGRHHWGGWGHGGRGWGGGWGWFFPVFPFVILFKILEAIFDEVEAPASAPTPPSEPAPPAVMQPITTARPLARCVNCQQTVSAEAAACPYCGQSVAQKACRYCGRHLASGRTHCEACGAPVR